MCDLRGKAWGQVTEGACWKPEGGEGLQGAELGTLHSRLPPDPNSAPQYSCSLALPGGQPTGTDHLLCLAGA